MQYYGPEITLDLLFGLLDSPIFLILALFTLLSGLGIFLYLRWHKRCRSSQGMVRIFLSFTTVLIALPMPLLFSHYYAMYGEGTILSFIFVHALLWAFIIFDRVLPYSKRQNLSGNHELSSHEPAAPFVLLGFLSVLTFLIMILSGVSFPLFTYIKNGFSGDQSIRFEFYQNPPYAQFAYSLIVRGLLSVVVSGLFIHWLSRRTITSGLLFFAFFLWAGFMSALSLEKQNPIAIMAVLLLTFFIVKRFSFKNIIVPVIIILAFSIVGGFMGRIQYGGEIGSGDIIATPFHFLLMRICIDMSALVFQMGDIVPWFADRLWFGNIRLLSLLGLPTADYSAIGVIADAMVCFGFLSVLLVPPVLLIQFRIVESALAKLPMPYRAIFRTVAYLATISLVFSNFVSTMITAIFVMIAFLPIFFRRTLPSALVYQPRDSA